MWYELLLLTMLLLPFFYYLVIKKKTWKQTKHELFPKSQGYRKEIIGALALTSALILGFYVIATGMALFETTTSTQVNDLNKVSDSIGADLSFSPLLFFVTLIVVLFLEEFFFRAFLTQKIGIVLSTIFFTIAHLGYGSIAEIIGVFFLGLILAYWYKKKKSLIQNYIGHLLYDLFAVAMYVLFNFK